MLSRITFNTVCSTNSPARSLPGEIVIKKGYLVRSLIPGESMDVG